MVAQLVEAVTYEQDFDSSIPAAAIEISPAAP
jgi:hypothetical protein